MQNAVHVVRVVRRPMAGIIVRTFTFASIIELLELLERHFSYIRWFLYHYRFNPSNRVLFSFFDPNPNFSKVCFNLIYSSLEVLGQYLVLESRPHQ
jgi:hypothetical protein